MPVGNTFNGLAIALALGGIDFDNDVFKLFFCTAANVPDPVTDVNLADVTQVSTANLVGITLTVSSVGADGAGGVRVVVDDFDLEASGGDFGPFRYVGIYDDTHADDKLIGFYDLGGNITILDGETSTLDFNQTTGFIVITPA